MKEKEKNIPVDFKEDQSKETEETLHTEELQPEAQESEAKKSMEEESQQTDDHQKTATHAEKRKGKKEKDVELHEARQRIAELEDRLLRLQAEFINYKKRTEKANLELGDYLKGEVIKKFIPIMDDFKHMMENIQKNNQTQDLNAIIEGIDIIRKKFEQIFEQFGVQKIDSLNEEFDPEIHEALMTQPVTDKSQDNKILQVYQEGYRINDRILRPGKVIVGKYEGDEQKN